MVTLYDSPKTQIFCWLYELNTVSSAWQRTSIDHTTLHKSPATEDDQANNIITLDLK
jgi:hypothetical protein